MGSLICQQVAADNRHVKKLVLLPSTPPAGMLLPFPVIVRTIMHYGLAMIPPGHKFMVSRRDAEEFIFSTGFTPVEKKEFFQELGPESGLALFEIFTQQVPLAVVHRNVCDVLVVGAKEDKTNPVSIQKEIARRLGDVPYVEIAGASHALIVQPSVRDRAFEAVAAWACPGLSLEAICTNRVGQFTIC
jgi:pimeloyl-ACP methyl ester carboxylesterase